MAALALIVVVILFIETTMSLNERQQSIFVVLDLSILSIFAVDYFYRLYKAPQKWVFIKGNMFDLVAIIPLDKTFRLARLARLTRLARLSRATRVTRLARVTIFMRRFATNISGVLKTNGLHFVLMSTTLIVILGGYGIYVLEPGMDTIGDALWWSMVTTTTVGYGDIAPVSLGGRLLAGFLMIVGIGLLGMVTASIATYFVNKVVKEPDSDNPSLADESIQLIKRKLDNLASLSDSEVEFLCNTIRAAHTTKQVASSSIIT